MASTLVFANNAGSTLAGSISNTALSLNLQAGGGALFPNPTTGQYFVITAIDAATGLLREIMWCTSRSSDTLTVIRAQEGTTAISWNAGDLINELWTAGQAGAMAQTAVAQFVRIVPQTTFYVNNSAANVTGDTTGDGLTTGTAWFSIAHSTSTLATYNLNGNSVTLQQALTGVNYATPGQILAPSNGKLIIQGDPAAQTSYAISGAGSPGNPVMFVSSGSVEFVGMVVENTGSVATLFESNQGSFVSFQNTTFTTTGTVGFPLVLASGGQIQFNSGCQFAGGTTYMWLSQNNGLIIQNANCATTSSPTYSTATVGVNNYGVIACSTAGLSWTGSGCTGVRYSAPSGAISTGGGGPNFFPGTSAGSATLPGLYS